MDAYQDKISRKLGSKEKILNKVLYGDESNSLLDSSSSSSASSSVQSNDEESRDDDDDDDNEDNEDNEDNDNEDEATEDDMDEDEDETEMLQAVERALEAKRLRQAAAAAAADAAVPKQSMVDDMEELANKMEQEQQQQQQLLLQQVQQQQLVQNYSSDRAASDDSESVQAQVLKEMTTSGIGGSWAKNETSKTETYRPANGGWGYFPRPKDISKAYGGGKKINPQSSFEDELRKQKEVEETRDKLKRYREVVGIDVQSEKDHAGEIETALVLGQRAMQRGIYGTAVSSLEKVTKWCSTNSQVGSQVFLELAMAYEATGRTSEAIQVYQTLSTSRMEDVKFNAKRLLYGIEAMQFMRDEAKSKSFSRKKISQTFIDTTGFGNISQNFDKVYNTAYIDLDRRGGYYRKLTQNVVRSLREARQILLAATDSSEVDRVKIVQALRSMDNKFSEALREQLKRNAPKPESVAMMNGVPIVSKEEEAPSTIPGLDKLNLGEIDDVLENIGGAWKLQLMADSKGDGVNFYNKTLSWQSFDSQAMSYEASGPSGFLTLSQKGSFDIDEQQRIITRKEVQKEGSAAFFTDVYSTKLTGATAAVNLPQQIISVDSELFVTRNVVSKSVLRDGNVNGYFCVWRRTQTAGGEQ